ncbi:polyamine aminopropyltransferase [Streptomyces armeniacus]|uniref:Polyamine aminopropyltransferase n=1 Tax=Streptomyces armeniacus TaxID=83291 RepID=A0A345XJI3_9ACTN|nr:polyamine aminopropyltransferase [Streptomyces armeniacus]AXK31799.1 polyamine aminopropyltransferase [Streptomyces armeniacus]
MIDRPSTPARLPVPAGVGRGLVLVSVFVCAACGLVYELELVALAAYLVGDSVTQASVVLSVMVFAMGIGSLLAKRLHLHAAVGFGVIEALLALVGGGSAMALYATFAWLGEARVAMVVFSVAIGVLIGAEMPLLMTLIQRIRAQDPGVAVADLFAADYVGALLGGLMFPFLLLPFFGQLTGTLLTGVVNALAGGFVVLWLFRRDLTVRGRWGLLAANGAVLALLLLGTVFVGPFERAARQAVYGPDVRVAVRSEIQEIVLTGDPRRGLELFLDGRLRFSSEDEKRYHESLVHPAMTGGPRTRVLILGGGDGLALREVLRYPGVRSVTVVELDPKVVELARGDPQLSRLNRSAFGDPRVRVATSDAFNWLRDQVSRLAPHRGPHGADGAGGEHGSYDVIVSALPDPGISANTKLYSQEFYGLAARALSERGRMVVHAGACSVGSRDFWTVESTMRSVGLRTSPYAVEGRAPGHKSGPDRGAHRRERPGPRDWSFVLASGHHAAAAPPVRVEPERAGGPRLASLTPGALRQAVRRAERARIGGLPPSTLMRPRY